MSHVSRFCRANSETKLRPHRLPTQLTPTPVTSPERDYPQPSPAVPSSPVASFAELILSQMATPLLVLDADTRQLVAINPALEQKLGYVTTDWARLSLADIVAVPDTVLNWHWEQICASGAHHLPGLQLQTADGRMLTVDSQGSRIQVQGQTLISLLLTQSTVEPVCQVGAPVTAIAATSDQPLDQEQLVGAIAQRVRHTLDLDTLVTAAVQELGHLLQAQWLAIVRYVPEAGVWRHIAEYRDGAIVPKQDLGMEIPDANNPVAAQLKHHQTIQILAPSDRQDPLNQTIGDTFTGTWLIVPLEINGELWGSLSLGQYKPNGWLPPEIQLVQAAAEQLMLAIEHSQLYQQVQQLNWQLEQTVHQRTTQLRQALSCEAMLKRITDKVRDSLDEGHILETVVAELAMLFGVDCCNTALYDVTRKTCTIAYEFAGSLPSAQGQTMHMAEQYPEIYAQLLCCQHVQFCSINHATRIGLNRKNVLACPIFDNQGVLGDIWLFRPSNASFDELEIRLIHQVANQCAIAIRQARLYQAAQTQVQTLEQINQLKDNFLSTVSHELRTPIATIKMAIQMLTLAIGREGLLPDPAKPGLNNNKIAHYLKILNDECNREIGLITDLLDLQRLEAGTHTVNAQPIQTTAYLKRLAYPFQEQAIRLQHSFAIACDANFPPLLTDPQSLERILVELLHNASKYTPAGGTIRLAATAIVLADGTPGIQLQVANTGIEIPPDQVNQIFDLFYRVPGRDPYEHSGTGLGLALVKRLVMQLHGQITVTTGNNQTCFTIELPLTPPAFGQESA